MVRDVPAHFMMQTGLFADDERSPPYSSGTEPKKLAIISLTTSTRNFQVHEFIKIQGERTENQIFIWASNAKTQTKNVRRINEMRFKGKMSEMI